MLMGRPRKNNTHLPPCVYPRHGAYYLVKAGKWTLLGHTLSDALTEYASRFESPSGGMAALIDEALPVILTIPKPLSLNTRKAYGYAAYKLKHMLAEFSPEQMTPREVSRLKKKLKDIPSSANTCLAVLKRVFDYAVEEEILDYNPATGVDAFPVDSRTRLSSWPEYRAVYSHADDQLQVYMDLLYKTGGRPDHVLRLPVANLAPEGIYLGRQKTDARLIVKWDDELRAIVERAKALSGNVRALTLLHSRGKPLRLAKMRERWIKACADAGVADLQLRDLRALSGTETDAQGKDAQALLGHTTKKTTAIYLRAKKIPVVEGPSFGQVLDIGQKKQENQ
jgi:integrase